MHLAGLGQCQVSHAFTGGAGFCFQGLGKGLCISEDLKRPQWGFNGGVVLGSPDSGAWASGAAAGYNLTFCTQQGWAGSQAREAATDRRVCCFLTFCLFFPFRLQAESSLSLGPSTCLGAFIWNSLALGCPMFMLCGFRQIRVSWKKMGPQVSINYSL